MCPFQQGNRWEWQYTILPMSALYHHPKYKHTQPSEDLFPRMWCKFYPRLFDSNYAIMSAWCLMICGSSKPLRTSCRMKRGVLSSWKKKRLWKLWELMQRPNCHGFRSILFQYFNINFDAGKPYFSIKEQHKLWAIWREHWSTISMFYLLLMVFCHQTGDFPIQVLDFYINGKPINESLAWMCWHNPRVGFPPSRRSLQQQIQIPPL